jgi:tetratricopeptide (TPR) repeat protein
MAVWIAALLMVAQADDLNLCEDAQDSAIRIPACTRVIDGGTVSGKLLGLVHGLRGVAYFSAGDFARAIPDLTDALPYSDPGDPRVELLRVRAAAHYRNGDFDKAIADFTASLATPDAVGLTSRAMVYLKMEHYAAALADYDAALKLQPDLPQALYGRGLAEQHVEMPGAAARDIAAARAINPDVVAAFAGEGLTPAP